MPQRLTFIVSSKSMSYSQVPSNMVDLIYFLGIAVSIVNANSFPKFQCHSRQQVHDAELIYIYAEQGDRHLNVSCVLVKENGESKLNRLNLK